jgi:hypothetical protein
MRGRVRQVPVAVYVGGAFLLDFLWVAFSVTGIDPTPWSDWSHSLVMTVIWATAFAAMFLVVFVRDEWKVGALSWRTLAACALVVALSLR